ncbi:iron-sulfur cluster biosynthesis protein [Lentzea sp. NPDC034063]|uniref:iron-sulfur cluster biosynthesis protein n=1 Tax=unclassified Lentzea TaxID=2643253 RepID=UPI0033D22E5A
MLDISPQASEAINSLTAQAGHAGLGGIRISTADEPSTNSGLTLMVADRPILGDEIVAGALGSRVFLDDTAAHVLTDLVLDVRSGDDGILHFTLRDKL